MDTNLDQYVNKIMDEQIHRDGIELFPIGLPNYLGENELREILTSLTDRFIRLAWVDGYRT